jgi:hypothetical protein
MGWLQRMFEPIKKFGRIIKEAVTGKQEAPTPPVSPPAPAPPPLPAREPVPPPISRPIFTPDDARFEPAPDLLESGEWISIRIYGPGEARLGRMIHIAEQDILFVQYPEGRIYGYLDVDFMEAESLLRAGQNSATPSGGTWVWSHLRIRGTINGHRKSYWLSSHREVDRMRDPNQQFPGWSPY